MIIIVMWKYFIVIFFMISIVMRKIFLVIIINNNFALFLFKTFSVIFINNKVWNISVYFLICSDYFFIYSDVFFDLRLDNFLNNFIKDVCKFLTQHKRQDLDFIISWNFLCIFDTEWNVHWILFVLFFRWKKTDWYLVPSYFVIKVELSNCKHKNFTVFTILKNGLVE